MGSLYVHLGRNSLCEKLSETYKALTVYFKWLNGTSRLSVHQSDNLCQNTGPDQQADSYGCTSVSRKVI